jgi:hypothetical protein
VLIDPKFSGNEPFVTDVRTAASAIDKKIEMLVDSCHSKTRGRLQSRALVRCVIFATN